ncbi:hypothetical protein P4H39_31255 [Paenibacillus lautus]|uniref:hypothetical protein n=1 Tax=Paenibacillus lautus TaxID=1401 RepID=UPI002DB8B070|nr:hypothetical protein [Paenibacillus lautus]MEC0207090.1 hypothetical protein [Paenibacillus lautus]
MAKETIAGEQMNRYLPLAGVNDGRTTEDYVAYVSPLPAGTIMRTDGAVVILIKESAIARMFHRLLAEEGAFVCGRPSGERRVCQSRVYQADQLDHRLGGRVMAFGCVGALLLAYRNSKPIAELLDSIKDFAAGETGKRASAMEVIQMAVHEIILFYGVSHWNSYFSAMLYMRSYDNYPLQLILREIVLQSTMAEQLASQGNAALAEDMSTKLTPESVQYATLVVSIVLMLIIYPFIQKYFVKGIMIGSLKG